jgi:hypothetical protein
MPSARTLGCGLLAKKLRSVLTGANYFVANYQNNVNGYAYRSSSVTALNDLGQAIGTSERMAVGANNSKVSRGQGGWFFDPTEGMTELVFDTSLNGTAFTSPQFLSESGVVLGYYTPYADGTNTAQPNRAFWWKLGVGGFDISALLNGTLSDAGWKSLLTIYGQTIPGAVSPEPGDPVYFIGTGLANGQNQRARRVHRHRDPGRPRARHL